MKFYSLPPDRPVGASIFVCSMMGSDVAILLQKIRVLPEPVVTLFQIVLKVLRQ